MAQQQQQNKNRSGDWKMKGKAFAESGWRDYIEEEMVCDIAGDMLMSPERARQLLLGSGNITTMRRVKDTIQNWIRDALDRLPSKSVKDPANIKKLRKAWKDTYDALERAYAETVKAVEAEAQKGDKRMSLGGMAREAAYAEWVKGKKGGRRYSLGDTRESFRERQKRAVKERGVVEPGLNEASVRVVDVPRHPYTGSIADATYQAIKAAKEKYVPNGNPRTLLYSNYGKQFEYKISGQAITICLSSEHQKESSDKGGHLALATQLDRVIGESIEVEEHPDRIKTEKGRDNSRINPDALMHRFYGVAKIGKTVYRVMTLLREDWRQGEGNGIHSYEAIEIEVLDEQTPNTSNGVDTPNSELEAYPVANLIKDVGKTMEPDKLLLDYSAKTTENGSEALNGGEDVRGDASQNETTSADGRRLSLNGDREERKALRESEESRKGLRELFGKDFDTFLNNVFNNVSEDIRKEIVEMASRRDWDSLTATEEYLALLAQSTDFDDARNRKVWSKVINYFMDLLRKVGITLNRPLTDNELRYILWRSYNRMEQRGVMGLADDMVMRDKLDIDSVLSVAGGEVEPQHGERGLRYSLSRGSRFAPDGTLSKLDEKQHKEVRTQNFKDWAGDWERNFLKDFLFEKNPVGEAEGAEFPKGETSLLEQVTEYYKKVCNGIILRKDIGSVLLDSRSVKDCIGHGVNRLKAAAFKVVPNIIESGVIIDSKENWKGRGYSSVTIAAPVLIGKKAYIGIAVVNELKDRDRGDNRFYLHGVVLKENLQSEEFKTGMVTGSKLGDIAKVLKEIVTTKESTKIVGKNGEPLVMTHNTPNEFYTFDRERIGSGQGQAFLGLGFNFSRGTNSIYGGREVKAYLDARNPLESGGHKLSQQNLMEALRKIDEGQSDTIVAELYGGYVPYDSPNYEKALRNVAKNLVEGYDDLGIYGTVSVVAGGARANDVIEAFKGLGFDSSIERNADGEIRNAVVFDPTQIKSATDNNAEFSRENPDIRFSLTKAPTFYSNAERAVENVKQEKAKAEQWKAMLTKAGGIKAGEDKWMGLSQWLDERRGQSLTKDEVLQFVRENGVRMEEVNYGAAQNDAIRYYIDEFDELIETNNRMSAFKEMERKYGDEFSDAFLLNDNYELEVQTDYYGDLTDRAARFLGISKKNYDRPSNSTRLNYTTPGLDNKREIAFVVPNIEPYQEYDEIHFGPENGGKAVMWVRFGETTDADGKRVLVIDEIQSNRHQEGKKRGYRTEEAVKEDLRLQRAVDRAQDRYDNFTRRMGDKYDGVYEDIYADMTDAERAEADRLERAVHDASEAYNNQNYNDVPAAPFEKNWHEVAMKRMLRLAAEEGFDKVAWTTGEQQAERYGLGRMYDSIEREDNPSIDGKRFVLSGGNMDTFLVNKEGNIEDSSFSEFYGKPLSDVVGKDLAERMMNLEDGDIIEGEQLNIGGEGMRGFYDGILTKYMDKYCRKWGTRVGETTLNTPGRETMHSVDVTPEMKESVMQGQPLFSLSREEQKQVRDTNRRFNEELDKQSRGELPQGHIYNLGLPASVLRSAGFPDLPIQLSATKLAEKAQLHGFNITDVRDLAAALQDPVAVFAYGDKNKAQNVIVEIVRDGKNFVVGVHFTQNHDGTSISSIRGLFNKDNAEWLNWINQGKLLYVDKEKIQTLIDQQRTNPAEVAYLDLDSVANLVNNFENPSIQSVKTTENGRKYSLSGGAQTHTENFKRWFGDWENDPENASKVVDENGRPKVVLHGTPNKDFFAFDSDKAGSGTDAGWLGRGFYFYGNAPEYASQYAGKSGRVLKVYLDIKNPYYASVEEFNRLAEANDPELSKQFREQLEEEGYDGVYYNGDLNEEWVAFRPEQIKSATDNNGEFSRENPDIRYSLSGGARRWWGEREEALRSEYDALAEQARPLRRARQEGTAYSPNELAAIDRQMRALRGKIDLVNKVNDLLDNAAARPKRVAPPICYLSTVICNP